MKRTLLFAAAASTLALAGCVENTSSATQRDAETTNRIQEQLSASQPVPIVDWSLERDLLIQLYSIRNIDATTHSVWRSDLGTVEGDCPSIGFGIPYDTSLTNPLVATSRSADRRYISESLVAVEQPEPNGVYASKNTAATWVMCAGETGTIEPVYVETRVTTYPYPVSVDYATNRVTKAGKSSVSIKASR